ncbi:molybdopterin molybdenumtransferase MoeA [Erythrobacter sp. QSSC1-22B]|uniref:molybdopterin molybdotransferase MoeA n=1 Tax=Erythrobacter sp. QSSC1-22B TaxID=1860125 RepID=UPI000805FED0|nr:molybdopterin molybdotransferase MoeA [Erythrobacter sp. QSSC1-22B]OBX20308.1 molybdopterin molybdenumtransferase MoeA [Erythrobacter sp. QSSC1-22B]
MSGGALLPLAEAQQRLLALARPGPIIDLPLADCLGHYLARPLTARRRQPGADLSAMDGYAIAWGDLPGPWRIAGESAAGRPYAATLSSGEAARISTGAILPHGADTIMVQEDAERSGDTLRLAGKGPPERGAHIRRAGHDFEPETLLAPAGTPVDARLIALAAMAGHGTLPVHRRLSVAILDTGDELVPPGAPLPTPAHIPASNGVMLAAILAHCPVDATLPPNVPDRIDAFAHALAAQADADIIITTGGASVGDHDLLQPALARLGGSVQFWRLAMRPGKPVMVAQLGQTIVLGLPGNPVSAFVTAQVLLLPLVRTLLGATQALPQTREYRAGTPLPAVGSRQDFVRVQVIEGTIHPLGNQDSGALHALWQADALAIRPANAPAAGIGDPIDCLMLG